MRRHRLLEELFAGADRHSFDPGSLFYPDGTPQRVHLIDKGLVRGFLMAAGGRQATTAYLGAGETVGIATLRSSLPSGNVQAILPTETRSIATAQLAWTLQRNPSLAMDLLEGVLGRWEMTVATMAIGNFASIRERVELHLLRHADWNERKGRLVARVSHQQLADAAGSVVDVVGRTLRELEKDGLVELARTKVVLLDPLRLQAEIEHLLTL